jgi:hypothetical protein
VLVRQDDRRRARNLLIDFGLGEELAPEEPAGG